MKLLYTLKKGVRAIYALSDPLRRMKYAGCLLLLLLSIYPASASDIQEQRLSFNLKNVSLETVFKEIETQTTFGVIYTRELLQHTKKVSILADNMPLETVLKICFKDQPVSYRIIDQSIIVTAEKALPGDAKPEHPVPAADTIISGIVKLKGRNDAPDELAPGVTVVVKGTSVGVKTDMNGNYSIRAKKDAVLLFSMVGFLTQEIPVNSRTTVNVVLLPHDKTLEEVTIVAYGTQKKQTMVSAVTTINPKELKGPTGNLTTMLAGRLSGVISYQRTGEPGKDNASFFIRGITTFGTGKVDPLILIDGMESTATDLARLQPDDIAGFSILKDATASSLYGARGANGVVLVNTKSGTEGKTKFNIRMENSLSTNTRNFKFADNITYMKLANEAVMTRNPLGITQYSPSKIDHTAAGDDPYLYPNNNWIQQLIKDYTINQRLNVNLTGGGKAAQYYIAGTYNVDNGVLNVDKLNNFNSNIKLKNYSVRSNVNINLTPTTQAIVRTYGQFDDYNGPVGGGATIFKQTIWANPVMFPTVFPSSYAPQLKHPLFGNAIKPGSSQTPGDGSNLYTNPYANAVSGYQQYNTSTLLAQLELKQDFSFLIPGLNARMMAYTERYSYFDVSRQYTPFYYTLTYDLQTKTPKLTSLNTNGTEYLNYREGSKIVNTTTYLEAALNYNHVFAEKHALSGMLITLFRNYLTANAGDLQSSLPHRNQGLSGRFTYAYDNRYMMEFNFGYNGSERFAKNHRFGFFPSVGVAWNIANESFFSPLVNTVNKLKVRATYGLVGNDQIGSDQERFFYLSNVNMSDDNRGATFGERYNYYRPGVSVGRYENRDISWEKSYKTNLGLELGLFNAVNILVDFYKERRSNILMTRNTIPSTMGLNASVQANVGEAEGKGVDLSLDYTKTFQHKMWLQIRGNFTYATSKLLVNEEPRYPEPSRYRVGHSLSQTFGLIAERLFVDDKEVANSPEQNFGQQVMGGDIKYRDVNGDGKITDADYVPIGLPTTPEITYGIGFSFGYHQWDLSCFFQGSARSSFWVSPESISPFVLNGGGQHGLLSAIAEDHWSEEDRNLYSFWPRLSDYFVNNNNQSSTWWMRSGDFLRLKTLELGYTFPQGLLRRLHLSNTRMYANAMNLFVLSKFTTWDPEMGGDGLGYPIQRVYNIGINFGF